MRIEHIAIWTKNIDLLVEFYTKYFNGKCGTKYNNTKTNFESYFIEFETGARLEIMKMPGVEDGLDNTTTQHTGIIHMAFSVGSVEKVDALTLEMKNKGVKILSEPRRTGDGYYESCIADPDGNRIEIVA